jgi:hypothetical protein
MKSSWRLKFHPSIGVFLYIVQAQSFVYQLFGLPGFFLSPFLFPLNPNV